MSNRRGGGLQTDIVQKEKTSLGTGSSENKQAYTTLHETDECSALCG